MTANEVKCRKLKAVRKVLADAMGIELNQRECTNGGHCSGTCPKCAAEEKKLNDAIVKKGALGAAAIAMSIGLTGCSGADLSRLAESLRELPAILRGNDDQTIELSGEVDINYPYPDQTSGLVPYEEILEGDVDLPEDFPEE